MNDSNVSEIDVSRNAGVYTVHQMPSVSTHGLLRPKTGGFVRFRMGEGCSIVAGVKSPKFGGHTRLAIRVGAKVVAKVSDRRDHVFADAWGLQSAYKEAERQIEAAKRPKVVASQDDGLLRKNHHGSGSSKPRRCPSIGGTAMLMTAG